MNCSQPDGQGVAFAGDVGESFVQLLFGDSAFLNEIEQSVLLLIEVAAFTVEVTREFTLARLLVCEGCLDRYRELGEIFGVQSDMRVEVTQLLLYERYRQVRQGARAKRLVAAFVIAVATAVAGDLGVDEPGVATFLLAPVAVERALEVVSQLVVVDSGVGSQVQHILDTIEERPWNERLMAAFELLTVIHGVARVIRISQHAVDGVVAERSGCFPLSERTRAEAEVFGSLAKIVEGVFACGIQLEEHAYQWCSLRVEVDGIDLFALDILADVEIADWRPADSSTIACLVRHLHADVFPASAVLEIVH